jgi:hypothetical protein
MDNQLSIFVGLFHPPDRPRNDGLEYRSTFIMEREDFINDG